MYQQLAIIQNFSFAEIAVVVFALVLLFGAKRLPELFGSMGRSINEFKRGMREEIAPVEAAVDSDSTISDSRKSS